MREVACALLLVLACSRAGNGPVEIIYDKEACGYCRMLISEPRFAAQLVTDDGDVLDFDDPGCLLRFVAERHPHTRAMWFRDARGDRWLAAADVRFVRVPITPMGWGFGAVDAGTPGALTFEAATVEVQREAKVAR